MPWRQLTTALRELRAAPLRDRFALHQARYRYTREEVGRVWLTVDGREIAQFDTSSFLRRRAELADELRRADGQPSPDDPEGREAYLNADAKAVDMLRRAGQYDDYGALEDLEAYLSLPVAEALVSPSPLVRALAVLDRRVGKRRLRAMGTAESEHPLVRELFRLRCEVERLGPDEREG